jgi:hypothetical protein
MVDYEHYTLYEITNILNGNIYVGMHVTNDLDDGYMGSSNILNRAIEKYGISNFKKEYIYIFDNKDDMIKAESELVNEEFISRFDTYNIKLVGSGGWDYVNSKKLNNSKNQYKIAAELIKTDSNYANEFSKKIKEGQIKSNYEFGSSFRGKRHSKETKRKIGKANSVYQSGKGNSQYGTMWIHNVTLKENKKIKKTDNIPDGWLHGRKMKF